MQVLCIAVVSTTGSKRRSTSILHTVIREELTARHWSLSHLADALGVQLGVVSRWVADDGAKRVVPLPHMCVQIARVLDLDVIEVFRLAGYLPPMHDETKTHHPHEDEIRAMQRMLGRILKAIPPADWALAYPVVMAYMDGLQLVVNRLEGKG